MKILSAVTIIAIAVFAIFPGLDLQFTSLFYNGHEFPLRGSVSPLKNPVSLVIDYSVRIFCVLSALTCLSVLVYDGIRDHLPGKLQSIGDRFRNLIKFSRRQLTFFLLIAVLTPGILVHWVMKPVWERARPVNVQEYGGKYTYTDFYHLRAGQNGNSFPSGHAAMAASIIALGFMVAPQRKKKVLIITTAYVILACMCRVWQGSHFLSDVTFSIILTLWTILLLKKFYLDKTAT